MSDAIIRVLTKVPVPGRVKTRLIPALGAEGAARLHTAMVHATLDLAEATGLGVLVSLAGDPHHPFADRIRARGIEIEPQAAGHLGDRMAHALRGPGTRIALGTDCPIFDPQWLVEAVENVGPIGFGPSEDGGYWTVLVRTLVTGVFPAPIFQRIPWSTAEVLALSVRAAETTGVSPTLLPTCYDIDEPPMLTRLAADPRCPPSLLPHLP